MTLFVFMLVAISASLHVLWNTLVKTCRDKASFAWLTSLVGTIVLLPLFIYFRFYHPGTLDWLVLGWSALSGLFEAAYVILLFNAYGSADLSVVYPLSRGVAPMVTLMLGGMLLGDTVSPAHTLAVGIIVVGVAGVSYSARNPSRKGLGRAGIVLAVATGCMIAGYHLVDRRAMSLPQPPNPVEYLFLIHLFQAIYVTLWIFLVLRKRAALFTEWTTNRISVLIVGFCTPVAYFLIVWALKFGNVTHVAAGRNIGIFISTVVGALFLKERVTGLRVMGALLIILGVMALVFVNAHA